jgi:hypothetical protein
VRGKTVLVVAFSVLVACKGHSEDATSTTETSSADDAGITTVESIDAGSGTKEMRVIALELITPVFNMTEWPAKDPSKTSEDAPERSDSGTSGRMRAWSSNRS